MTASVAGPKSGQISRAGFIFGETGAGSQPNTVNDLMELKCYIVNFNDNEAKKQTRIVFKIPGFDQVYVVNEKVSGTKIVASANDWFNKAIADKLSKKSLEVDPKAGTEGAAQV